MADSMEKSVRFTMNTPAALPKGTQLTLVEGSTKRAYYYTADGSEKNDGKGIIVSRGCSYIHQLTDAWCLIFFS